MTLRNVFVVKKIIHDSSLQLSLNFGEFLLQKKITQEGELNCVFRNLKFFLRLKTRLLSNTDKPITNKEGFDTDFIRR